MKSVGCVVRITFQNFRKWSEDRRLWIVAILVLLLCIDNLRFMNIIAAELGDKASLWLYPFTYSQFYMKLIFSLPIILMFCNAPFVDSNKLLVLMRAGGLKYLVGQMGYIVLASLAYYSYILICTILVALPFAEISTDWGDIIYTLAYSMNAAQVADRADLHFLEVTGFVVQNYSPISACLLTLLLSWLNGTMFGFIMLFCNLMTGSKYLGSFICGALMALSAFMSHELFGNTTLTKFSPLSWITLDVSGGRGNSGYPDIPYCIAVYIIASVLLGAAILFFGRRRILKMEAA